MMSTTNSTIGKRVILIGLSTCFGVLFFACQNKKDTVSPESLAGKDIELSLADRQVAGRNTAFAFRFFRQIADWDKPDSSFFISPLSASCVLSMTANGAAGACLDEMKAALSLDSLPMDQVNSYYQKLTGGLRQVDPQTELGLSNSLWVHERFTVRSAFQKLNRESYDAEIRNLDFTDPGTVRVVNQWCADKTKNRIPEVLDRLSDTEPVVLINALYFQGKWESDFPKDWTSREPFTVADGTSIPVDMMHQIGLFRLVQDNFFDIVELPYGNNAFSMVVLLPSPDKSREDCRNAFTEENWRRWEQEGEMRNLDLKLPRFKMEDRKSLLKTLKSLGMRKAFLLDSTNFPRLAKGKLAIGDAFQNTFISVDEGGTEAAAATVVTIVAEEELPPSLQPYPFHVNRPFLFLIKEKSTGTILFMGKVTRI